MNIKVNYKKEKKKTCLITNVLANLTMLFKSTIQSFF